jgi:hypothetical protein
MLSKENNPAATGNMNYCMDYSSSCCAGKISATKERSNEDPASLQELHTQDVT